MPLSKPFIQVLQAGIHAASLAPLAILSVQWAAGLLGPNPIQELTQRTGSTALTLLVLSLACTPLNTITGFSLALRWRRPLGLYAFLYAATHFLIYIGLDYGFNWQFLLPSFTEKPFIILGAIVLTGLGLLAVTSINKVKRRMGKAWKRLHRLVYALGLLAVVHFAWASKADLFRLSGDLARPLIYAAILLFLLSLRLPPVKQWITRQRQASHPYRRT
jgi:sulfoxide reductase heme-binding subunit YedZ